VAYEQFTASVFERLASRGFDDLRPAHAQVFQHIKEEGVRLTALARSAGLTPQSMGYLVDELERRGYVERAAELGDRRAILVLPTDRGRAEIVAARQIIADLEREWAAHIGDDEFERLLAALDAAPAPEGRT